MSNYDRRIWWSLRRRGDQWWESRPEKKETRKKREIRIRWPSREARLPVRLREGATWKGRINVRNHRILRVCKTDTMPSVFCAFYARFSVSFLCQSARDHNGGRDTLCNSENECEAFRIIITRPRPVLAVCFIHTYIRVTYVHLTHAHARSMRRRAVLDNRGVNVVMCATAQIGNRARYLVTP